MRMKRTLLIVSIATLMVLSSLFLVNETYAYWRNDVLGASDAATATVATGEWDQIFQWDPNATYLTGDVVENNGVFYEAKRDNPTREPGVDRGWNRGWTQL